VWYLSFSKLLGLQKLQENTENLLKVQQAAESTGLGCEGSQKSSDTTYVTSYPMVLSCAERIVNNICSMTRL
jgi:hypothetical protein